MRELDINQAFLLAIEAVEAVRLHRNEHYEALYTLWWKYHQKLK